MFGQALKTDQTQSVSPDEARLIPLLGLAGEAGQLLSEYKRDYGMARGTNFLWIGWLRSWATYFGMSLTSPANLI